MASAVDHGASPASPSGKTLKISEEKAPAKPRMNPVACEVQVIATGARPSDGGGKRELFTEETTTALVFENGGVLKLAAAVALGQLLFLTHKETRREVVAQVTRKRDFRPMICYVEVEFSEPSPGFWGIEFPKMAAAPVSTDANIEAAEEFALAEEELIGDEPSAPTIAPSAQEVMALKNEMEVLREQLKLLQAQTEARSLLVPATTREASGAAALEAPRAPVEVAAKAAVVEDAPLEKQSVVRAAEGKAAAVEISKASPSDGAAPSAAASKASSGAPASEPADGGEASFSEEDLLPKPALDFKSAKRPVKPASTAMEEVAAAASSRSGSMRKDVLFAAFVLIVAGAVGYQNLLPMLTGRKNIVSTVTPKVAARPAGAAASKTANGQADSGKSAQSSETPATSPSAVLHDEAQGMAAKTATTSATTSATAVAETPTGGKPAADAKNDAETPREKPEVAAPARGKKHLEAPGLSYAALVAAAPSSDGVAIVPPKLIKAVRGVASPKALQAFSAGGGDSVTFDAVVDTSGRVKSMKVLSGLDSLQSAAMEALKKYQYEPATRRGKPVAAHVTVTVKFLFEP